MKHSSCQLEFAQLLGKTVTETSHPSQAPPWPSAWVILQQEVPVRNTALTSHYQPEESGKGQKRGLASPRVAPERSLLESVLPERWGRPREGPWVRTIGHRQSKTNPLTINLGPRAGCRAVLPGALTPLLSPGAPAQRRLLLCQHVSPRVTHFWA